MASEKNLILDLKKHLNDELERALSEENPMLPKLGFTDYKKSLIVQSSEENQDKKNHINRF